MQAPTPCPKCGEFNLYRSRSRSHIEKAIKIFLPMRTYRCHDCNWRGWMNKRKMAGKRSLMQSILIYLVIFIITLALAYFLHRVILE